MRPATTSKSYRSTGSTNAVANACHGVSSLLDTPFFLLPQLRYSEISKPRGHVRARVRSMGLLESREERYEMVCELLRAESTLTLATVDDEGMLHATPLYYLFRRPHLFWLSSASSAHSQILERHPRTAAAVFHSTDRWQQICGVQLRGAVQAVDDKNLRHAVLDEYAARFALGQLPRLAMATSTLYQLTPQWIRYIDNRRYFGYKFELTFNEED